jgi:gluconate 5-dehydrogenase/2-deoxy-D-gluconate 3-dehydrogenase
MENLNINKLFANFDLTGKVAVVLGGTRGIGRGIALGLAQAGADVISSSRNEKNCKQVAEEIEAIGRKTLVFPTDASNYDSIKALRDKAIAEFGKVDILVNSQGTEVRGDTLNCTLEDWRKLLTINLETVFMAMKIFGEKMVENKSGKVINIASMSSFLGIAGSPAYTASKGGVNQLTKATALEWAKENVQVNAIAPGWFRTELTDQIFSEPESAKKIVDKIPYGRPGTVDELAGAAIFLASQASDYVTGITIPVDGGFLYNAV